MAEREIVLCDGADELSHRGAELFVALAARAVNERRRFTVALSGGSTPKYLYERLASSDYAQRVAWDRVHLFWGDERCVPPDHPQSNYRLARESLISKVPIPQGNVHRMVGEKTPAAAAAEYEQTLRTFFQLSNNAPPRFDLILLGIGEEGHTASLFPGSPVLNDAQHLVAAVFVEKLKAHRLTLTLPVLNNAAEVIFLVSGERKAAIVKALFGGRAESQSLPAARVNPGEGRVTWLITRDAAGELR